MMALKTKLFLGLFLISCLFSCKNSSEQYEDALRQGSWYVYDIQYFYKFNYATTPELTVYIQNLLSEGNLLFLPGDELAFGSKDISVRLANGNTYGYSYYFMGDAIMMGNNGSYFRMMPEGDAQYFIFTFNKYSLIDKLEDEVLQTKNPGLKAQLEYLLESAKSNIAEFYISYLLQRPVPAVIQLTSGTYSGQVYDGNDQLINKNAGLNLFWQADIMNLSLDEQIQLEDGSRFYIEMPGLSITDGFTPGSYNFTGSQQITVNGGLVEIRVSGRYNANSTLSVDFSIRQGELLYELFYKGKRFYDRSSSKSKGEQCITLHPRQ